MTIAWRSLGIDCFADRNSTLLREAVTNRRMTIAWRNLGIDWFADRNSTFLSVSLLLRCLSLMAALQHGARRAPGIDSKHLSQFSTHCFEMVPVINVESIDEA